MDAFWGGTDWYWWGIYIGGSNMACDNNNVTQAYIDQEIATWRMQFIWVGPQPPCSGYANRFPSNTTDAFNQGKSIAQNAYDRAVNLGLNVYQLPLVYDLEAFDTTNATCLAATKAFLRGWTSFLHQGSTTQTSGLYGSVCGSGLDEYWGITPKPDFIWGAKWDGNPDTGVLSCVGGTHWTNTRHKQYLGEVQRTANGVTLTVDVNCSAGPLYGNNDVPSNSDCS